jgi:hypothetical protein
VTLDPGLIGSYTSTAVDDAGTLWIAGYLEANWDQPAQFGDLVVGKYDGTSIEWTLVDGVPTEPPVDGAVFNLEGFRGGQTAPGDDVGLWTSIGISPADGRPAVAYYDRTNKALKLARFDGSAWAIETIDDDPAGDMGRYAKLVFDGSNATIAYLATEAVGSGFAVSKVKLAKQNGGSYSFEDAIVDKETPCRPDLCSGGSKCTEEGRCATAGTGCPMCATGEQCLTLDGAAACRVVVASKLDTYPMTTGVYVDVATLPDGGLGLAYYDRIRGTANVAARGANGWEAVVVDGGVQPDGSATDVGPAMSLAIDGSGDWHLTYIDGYAESLKYARVSGGEVQEVEIIDEGFGIGDVPFADGQHIIGDDSFVHVTPQGTVQVTYQDATAGTLRFATGTPKTGGGHDWSVKVVDSDAFAGFFSSQIEVGGALKLVHWGRKLMQAEDGSKLMVGDVIVSSAP